LLRASAQASIGVQWSHWEFRGEGLGKPPDSLHLRVLRVWHKMALDGSIRARLPLRPLPILNPAPSLTGVRSMPKEMSQARLEMDHGKAKTENGPRTKDQGLPLPLISSATSPIQLPQSGISSIPRSAQSLDPEKPFDPDVETAGSGEIIRFGFPLRGLLTSATPSRSTESALPIVAPDFRSSLRRLSLSVISVRSVV